MRKSKIMDSNDIPEHIMEEIYRLCTEMKRLLLPICGYQPMQLVVPALNLFYCNYLIHCIQEIKRLGATDQEMEDFKDTTLKALSSQIEMWQKEYEKESKDKD